MQSTNLAAPGDMNYTVKFAVTGTANPAPGFKIVNLTGVVNLPVKRIDTNTLDFALKKIPPEPPPPKPIEVCITNLPNAAPCKKPKEGVKFLEEKIVPPRKPPAKRPPRRLSPEMQERLNRQLENLQLRDILRP